MIALIFCGLVFLGLVAAAICGNLNRIADAVEAQNRHYGVTEQPEKKAVTE